MVKGPKAKRKPDQVPRSGVLNNKITKNRIPRPTNPSDNFSYNDNGLVSALGGS